MFTIRTRAQNCFALSVALALLAFTTNTTLAQNARVQIIHNAADPAAAAVDIYINGALALDDFAFRAATPYLDLPAEVALSVAVAPGNSTGVGEALATFDLTLEEGETYVVVANGVLDPTAFAANPNGRSTGFTLWVKTGVRESIKNAGSVGYIIGHGATDAPAVDVRIRELGRRAAAARNAAYGDITNRSSIPARAYTLDVALAGPNTVVASYEVDLNGLGGNTAVVLTSGFLDPSANQNGTGFALIAALPDGTVVELPQEGSRTTGFTLWVKTGVRESIKNAGSVGYIIGHGATDAPAVDVRIRELGRRAAAARNAAYGDITNRSSIPARAYTLDVALAGVLLRTVCSIQRRLRPTRMGGRPALRCGLRRASASLSKTQAVWATSSATARPMRRRWTSASVSWAGALQRPAMPPTATSPIAAAFRPGHTRLM